VAVLLFGGIYLKAGADTLVFVLPAVTVCFWLIAVLQLFEARAAGARGIIAYLPAIALFLVAAFASLGTLLYWAGVR